MVAKHLILQWSAFGSYTSFYVIYCLLWYPINIRIIIFFSLLLLITSPRLETPALMPNFYWWPYWRMRFSDDDFAYGSLGTFPLFRLILPFTQFSVLSSHDSYPHMHF